jgi:hypothetical protein
VAAASGGMDAVSSVGSCFRVRFELSIEPTDYFLLWESLIRHDITLFTT